VVVASALGAAAIAARWRTARPAERLLGWWLLIGLIELTVHDAGNERRYVMFIPVLIALASLVIGSPRLLFASIDGRPSRWITAPMTVGLAYLVIGSMLRVAFLPEVHAGDLRLVVRLSAALSIVAGIVVALKQHALAQWLSRQLISSRGAAMLVALIVLGDLGQYAQWATHRTDLNYRASIEVGRLLAPGTAVHGKLANGLSLENRIRPVFVGNGFGNYADRKTREDVRYILTYTVPYVGYEGRVIRDVLNAYPQRTIVKTFDVAETGTGHDRAALLDKFGGRPPTPTDAVSSH
jgi:hypothetical protein